MDPFQESFLLEAKIVIQRWKVKRQQKQPFSTFFSTWSITTCWMRTSARVLKSTRKLSRTPFSCTSISKSLSSFRMAVAMFVALWPASMRHSNNRSMLAKSLKFVLTATAVRNDNSMRGCGESFNHFNYFSTLSLIFRRCKHKAVVWSTSALLI